MFSLLLLSWNIFRRLSAECKKLKSWNVDSTLSSQFEIYFIFSHSRVRGQGRLWSDCLRVPAAKIRLDPAKQGETVHIPRLSYWSWSHRNAAWIAFLPLFVPKAITRVTVRLYVPVASWTPARKAGRHHTCSLADTFSGFSPRWFNSLNVDPSWRGFKAAQKPHHRRRPGCSTAVHWSRRKWKYEDKKKMK